MAEITGFREVEVTFMAMARDAAQQDGSSVIVGFTQEYGIYVHENLEARHPIGQAKFLEEPARTFAQEIGQIIANVYRKSRNLLKSLFVGGLRLQREAQIRCPVDTGALRASAFTREEKAA